MRDRADRDFDRFRDTGDPRQLASAFDRTAPELWRVAGHLCRDAHDAEDAVQSAFVAAIEHAGQWDGSRPLMPWLLGLLVNRVREQRRRSQRAPDPERIAWRPNDDPAEVVVRGELGAAVRDGLRRLDEPYRSAVEQHLLHDKGAQEIADELGVSAGAVRMRIHRGLDQLRRALPAGVGAAGGFVALPLTPATHAAMRQAVLAKVSGTTSAGVGALSLGLLGILTMKHVLVSLVATLVAVLTFSLWPTPAPDPQPAQAAAVDGVERAQSVEAPPAAAPAAAASAAPPAVREAVVAPLPPAGNPARGTVRLVVRQDWDQAPVVGFSVAVLPCPRTQEPAALPSTLPSGADADAFFASGVTDADGAMEAVLLTGPYEVRFDQPDNAPSPTVDVVEGAVAEVRIDLPARLHASVTVVDDQGNPAAGATILGVRSPTMKDGGEVELGRTDQTGRWSGAFVDREVTVRAVMPGRGVSMSADIQEFAQEARLVIGGRVATLLGTVRLADGSPCDDALVLIAPKGHADAEPIRVRTTVGGAFRCDFVPVGACAIVASRRTKDAHGNPQPRFVLTAVEVSGEAGTSIDLRFSAGACLAARLEPEGGAAPAMGNVTMRPLHAGLKRSLRTMLMTGANTNREGSAVLEGLCPGPWEARITANGIARTERVELSEGERRDLVVAIDPPHWVEIEVVDESGEPMVGWIVDLVLPGASVVPETTSPKGIARFEAVGDREVKVAVSRQPRSTPLARGVAPLDQRTRIVVTTAAMAVRAMRGRIEGEGVDFQDLKVRVMPANQDPSQAGAGQTEGIVDSVSHTFVVEHLPPGTYHLVVVSHGRPVATRMNIDLATADADLGALFVGNGTIELAVSCTDGRAIEEPMLAIEEAGKAWLMPSPGTGNAFVRELPSGSYRLVAWAANIAPETVPVAVAGGDRKVVPLVAQPGTPTRFEWAGEKPAQAMVVDFELQRAGVPFVHIIIPASDSFVCGLPTGTYHATVSAGSAHGSADFTVDAASANAVGGKKVTVALH